MGEKRTRGEVRGMLTAYEKKQEGKPASGRAVSRRDATWLARLIKLERNGGYMGETGGKGNHPLRLHKCRIPDDRIQT